MALQDENTSLAFDTDVFRTAAEKYRAVGDDLRKYASDLDKMLTDLVANGWSTPAGKAFHEMTKTSWSDNIEKYADLMETLSTILTQAANDYDNLVSQNVELLSLNL